LENLQPEARPRELRAAIALLWAAFAAGIGSSALEIANAPAQGSLGVAILLFTAAFVVVSAAITYFFSLARNWARIGSLILFLMNVLGAFELPSVFERSSLAGWFYVSELLMQAVAMFLAFATPASKAFKKLPGDDAALRAMLPVGRSGWAIAAGYLALFSVLLLPAPFALVCGLLAIRDMRKHPEKHGMGRAIFGIIMGSLGLIAIVALVGFRMTR
jgi:Domain of unknown function (DUF4190)